LAADPGEQEAVHLTHEPDGHGESFCNPSESVLQCHDVVANLPHIVSIVFGRHLASLIAQKLGHIRFCALDPGAQHGLEPKVRTDQEVRIWEKPADTAQAMHSPRRLVQELHGIGGEVQPTWQVTRDERPVPFERSSHGPSLGRCIGVGLHDGACEASLSQSQILLK
jgi:hypothetical protein